MKLKRVSKNEETRLLYPPNNYLDIEIQVAFIKTQVVFQ